MSFIGKFREKWATGTPADRAKIKAGALAFCALYFTAFDELITGRPMKALGIFICITLAISAFALLCYISFKLKKFIGENAAAYIVATIVIVAFFGFVYFVMVNWGK